MKFPGAPHKVAFEVIVAVGKLDQLPALLLVEDSKQEVVKSAVPDAWESLVDKSLLQEEADQGGLVVLVPQRSQALEDASDAQVVMGLPVEGEKGTKRITGFVFLFFVRRVKVDCSHVQVLKSLNPVRGLPDRSRFLILQPDPVEIQHQLVGLQQVFLGCVTLQKSLEK